jgi:hypothetical protein
MTLLCSRSKTFISRWDMKPHFKVGDKVYRNYPFDGTPKQGHPDTKRVFTITKIDHFEPVDGVKVPNCVCWLKPGVSWSFPEHLTKAW